MQTLNDYLSNQEASQYTLVPEHVVCEGFGVRPSTLRTWQRKRGFPAPLRIPGYMREHKYHLGALRRYIDKQVKEAEERAAAKYFASGM